MRFLLYGFAGISFVIAVIRGILIVRTAISRNADVVIDLESLLYIAVPLASWWAAAALGEVRAIRMGVEKLTGTVTVDAENRVVLQDSTLLTILRRIHDNQVSQRATP